MEELLDNPEAKRRTRPAILTLACTLTWVGCGLLLVVLGFIASFAAATGGKMMMHFYFACLSPILSLVGSIMMFNRRKVGFFIYVFGQLLFSIAGAMDLSWGGSDPGNLTTLVVYFLVPVAFIFVYATQVNHFGR